MRKPPTSLRVVASFGNLICSEAYVPARSVGRLIGAAMAIFTANLRAAPLDRNWLEANVHALELRFISSLKGYQTIAPGVKPFAMLVVVELTTNRA
jgi:hypothetical protein